MEVFSERYEWRRGAVGCLEGIAMCFLLNWATCVSGLSLEEGPAEEEDGKKPIPLNRGAWSSPDLAPRNPSPHPVIVQESSWASSRALCWPAGDPPLAS